MRTKITLLQSEGRRSDLVVTSDATATVGDVAQALYLGDPAHRGASAPAALSLRVLDHSGGPGRVLDPCADLTDAGVRSGSAVELTQLSADFAAPGEGRGPAAAVVRVLAGPDAGREFPLPVGASTLGRDHGVDVRLTDPLVSKTHCRLNVGEHVEVLDLNSANGVLLGGTRVSRVTVAAGDVLVLGDTSLVVVPLQRATQAPQAAPAVLVTRSPRVVRRFPERDVAHPKPPEMPGGSRFPLVAMVAPLIMGAVLWFTTHQVLSLIFVALSPLLMIGSWLDQRLAAKRALKAQMAVFDEACSRLERELEAEHAVERAVRLSRHPSLAEAVDAIDRLGPLLWTLRPEHREFLTLRLGVGAARSALSIRLPDANATVPAAWDRLTALAASAAVVDGVPVVADLRLAGSLGVAGGTASAVAVGLVLQAVTLHAPDDLVVACVASSGTTQAWQWLTWLPHVGNQAGPLGALHLADNPGTGSVLLERLEGVVESRTDQREARRAGRGPIGDGEQVGVDEPVLPAILLVVEDDTPVSRARLVRLAERGPDVGVHLLWVAREVTALPAACRTFLAVGAEGSTSGEVREGALRHPVQVEPLTVDEATRLGRSMSPLVDDASIAQDDSDLPRAVAYPTLAGLSTMDDPQEVAERWLQVESVTPRDGSTPQGRRKKTVLTALVGMGPSAPMSIDLRLHGPHALVGGTTGAGKSEFLQSWVLGMARANSPDRLAFLFVDYKGGAAFADCLDLPHTVGLVTDLSPHLVRRALTSLRAELRFREHLLNRKKVKDLASLERTWDPETPPSLIIVVDEFAALANEVPEFVDGVVDVAQRGRSLGLHLILATQRPAGVIKDNLRANTNLRVALRLADADDSMDVLGVPDAAQFDPAIPGRGAVKTGPGRIQSFQTGYVGGWTSSSPRAAQVDIEEMGFGGAVPWELPTRVEPEESETGPTDIARMVKTVRAAARELKIPEPRKPWLAELAATYDFARLPNPRTDLRLVLGVADDPANQDQPVFAYEPDKDGNLAIYGTGGSGKSAALRTLAVAAAATARGGPVHVYGLDFASRGLRPLEVLPHVGAVVDGDDAEGVGRVLRRLRDIVDDRVARFAAVRADSLADYRVAATRPDEPRILLLVDGISAFRDAYEFSAAPEFATFAQIAADGRAVGVHVIVTGERPNAVPMSIASTIQRRIVLRQAVEDDYLLLGTAKDVLSAQSPPGRGVVEGNEVQLAVLGGSSNLAVQSRELAKLAEAMSRHGVRRAEAVGRLGTRVPLASLPASVDGRLVIGVDDETLQPATLEPRGALLVSGPPGSGRSTAMATIAAAALRQAAPPRVVLLAPRASVVAASVRVSQSYCDVSSAQAGAARLADSIVSGGFPPGGLVVLVEMLAEFAGTPAEMDIDRMVREALRAGHMVVGESESSTWGQAYLLAAPFKAGRRGLLLVPGDTEGDTLLGTPLGRFRRADFPPGRAFLVGAGRARRTQIALPGDG